MNFKEILKKQGIATWIFLGTLVLVIIGLALFGSATKAGMDLVIASGSQPFYEASRPEDSQMLATVVPCGVVALVALLASLVADQFNFDGLVGKILEIVIGVCRLAVPVLLGIAVLNFLYGSFTGLGWTFFSNEELVIAEEAKAVGGKVIAGLVLFLVALIASVVASFFKICKKED